MKAIRESGWRRLRDLKPIALERFCSRVLSEVERAGADPTATSHQRYLAVCDLVWKRDKELADISERLSRSSAVGKLVAMHHAGLLTAVEMAGFSEDIRSLLARVEDA
jgi:hypothetical protein